MEMLGTQDTCGYITSIAPGPSFVCLLSVRGTGPPIVCLFASALCQEGPSVATMKVHTEQSRGEQVAYGLTGFTSFGE